MKRVAWLFLASIAVASWQSAAEDARTKEVVEKAEKAAVEAERKKQTVVIPQQVNWPMQADVRKKENSGAKRSSNVPAGKTTEAR